MDSRNLNKEQKDALDEAIRLIDGVLDQIDIFFAGDGHVAASKSQIISQLHDARNRVNAVATGERMELGRRL